MADIQDECDADWFLEDFYNSLCDNVLRCRLTGSLLDIHAAKTQSSKKNNY